MACELGIELGELFSSSVAYFAHSFVFLVPLSVIFLGRSFVVAGLQTWEGRSEAVSSKFRVCQSG